MEEPLQDRPRLFVNRKTREDLFNAEDGSHWSYYLTHWLQVFYMLAFVFGVCLLLTSAYVTHTHFRTGDLGNVLYSERYTSLWWISLFFAATRFWFFLVMQSMFLYRNWVCCGRYAGCTIFWMFLLMGLFVLEVLALAINTNFMAHCNGVNAYGNPCNSPHWCCVPAVRVLLGNHCPNPGSNCITDPGPVNPDAIFVAIFVFSWVFVVLDAYFVALPMVLWVWQRIPDRSQIAPPLPGPPEPDATQANEAEKALLDVAGPIDASAPESFKRRVLLPMTPLLASAVTEKSTKQP